MLIAAACTAGEARILAEPREFDPFRATPDAILISPSEYKFDVGHNTAKAGTIQLVAGNIGKQKHEVVIVPVSEGRYGAPVAEIEAFGPQERRGLKVDLAPGRYEFVCLLVSVEDGNAESHMALGMREPFEVVP